MTEPTPRGHQLRRGAGRQLGVHQILCGHHSHSRRRPSASHASTAQNSPTLPRRQPSAFRPLRGDAARIAYLAPAEVPASRPGANRAFDLDPQLIPAADPHHDAARRAPRRDRVRGHSAGGHVRLQRSFSAAGRIVAPQRSTSADVCTTWFALARRRASTAVFRAANATVPLPSRITNGPSTPNDNDLTDGVDAARMSRDPVTTRAMGRGTPRPPSARSHVRPVLPRFVDDRRPAPARRPHVSVAASRAVPALSPAARGDSATPLQHGVRTVSAPDRDATAVEGDIDGPTDPRLDERNHTHTRPFPPQRAYPTSGSKLPLAFIVWWACNPDG